MTKKMKVVIAGAGSIGCYIGGWLCRSSAQVHFLARPRIIKDLDDHGLHITNWQGADFYIDSGSFQCEAQSGMMSNADLILVCVKSRDTATMGAEIKACGNDDAVVVSMQNGVGNAELLRKMLPHLPVIAGMVPYNVVYRGKGHFHCGTEGELHCDGGEFGEKLKILADEAGLPLRLDNDMPGILWGKLLLNLNNPVNALSGLPLKQQLEDRGYRRIYAACLREALSLLHKAGIKPGRVAAVPVSWIPWVLALPDFLFKRVAQAMLAIDPQARSSMWEDLKNGRPTEVDYINGEIVLLGQRLGIPTPVNETIVDRIRQAEEAHSGSPRLMPAEIL